MKKVNWINRSGDRVPKASVLEVLKWLPISHKAFKAISAKEITLVFVDEDEGRSINFEFRKKNYATDVLSFSPIEESSLGELVLCPIVLKRQAAEHQLSQQEELIYMVLHGVLHLLGYDHERSTSDARIMFKIQDEVFDSCRKKFKFLSHVHRVRNLRNKKNPRRAKVPQSRATGVSLTSIKRKNALKK